MKKIFILMILSFPFLVKSQSLCLQTMCTAAQAHVGDTVTIGAILTASNGYGAIAYKLISGPNTPVAITQSASYTTSIQAQQNIRYTGLVVGTYAFQVTGTDLKGGTTSGVDSIVVAAACPIIPAPRTVTGLSITIFGVVIPIPAGQGTKILLSDGTTQSF